MVVDVPALLRQLGIAVRRSGNEWVAHCPNPAHRAIPGSTAATKTGAGTWHIEVEGDRAGQHVCFSCAFGGGPIALVRAVLGVTGREAREWLGLRSERRLPGGVRISDPTKVAEGPGRELHFPRGSERLVPGPRSRSGDLALAYLETRHLSEEDVARYGIVAVPDTARSYRGRAIVPVVVDGRMVDFVARLYVPADELTPKALSGKIEEGARKELSLWGYDELDPSIGRVVVVEGVWGAHALKRRQVPNVLAGCGSAWSEERTDLLAGYDEVVLMPDGDPAGSKLESAATGSLRYSHRVLLAELPAKMQPDTDVEVALRALDRPRAARAQSSAPVAVLREFTSKADDLPGGEP